MAARYGLLSRKQCSIVAVLHMKRSAFHTRASASAE